MLLEVRKVFILAVMVAGREHKRGCIWVTAGVLFLSLGAGYMGNCWCAVSQPRCWLHG